MELAFTSGDDTKSIARNDTSFIFAFVYNCDIIHFQLNELSIETMKGFEESCSN